MLGTDAGTRGRANGASNNSTNIMGLARAAAAVRRSQQGGKGLRRRSMDGRNFAPGVRVVSSGKPALCSMPWHGWPSAGASHHSEVAICRFSQLM